MVNAYISGTGGYVPPRVVTNTALREQYGMDIEDGWVEKRSGIEERRYAEEGVNTSDLALHASVQALEAAKLTARDLDMILFATLSPDLHFPGTGVFLQRKLGLLEGDNPKFVPAMDIRNQCSGFLYGLSTATAMVRSGMAKHVLVVGAETHSAAMDFTTRGRAVTSLFGDGAGAVVVSATEEDRGVRCCFLGADGRHAESLWLRLWDVKNRPYLPLDANGVGQVTPEMAWPQMDGKRVFRHAIDRMCSGLRQACADQNLAVEDVELFCFHQANLRINEYVAKELKIPKEKLIHNIQKYGNTTAATIPLLLAEAERTGRLTRGMTIAATAFGSGFTWGSAIIKW